ncbi:MAG: type II toxin-antitoxin system VapC family toxin [Planctomycetota bacterium]
MISGPVVVDSSVIVEGIVRLRHWDAAFRIIRRAVAGEIELWAPDVLYLEVVSALRKLVARKAVDVRAGSRAAGWLTRLPILVTGTAESVPEIWKLRDPLSAYDAAYAVLARRLECPLLTSDTRLARALRRRRARVMHLDELTP